MTLSEYMVSEGLSLHELAARIGDVSEGGLRKWLSGERIPRPDQQRRIYKISGGMVQPNDWILDPDSRGEAA
jgi:transcriptional regulator with XRE-family HTH domain